MTRAVLLRFKCGNGTPVVAALVGLCLGMVGNGDNLIELVLLSLGHG